MSTRRADFRAALIGILDDFKAANPTMIRQTYRAIPATFHPPLAYIGPFTEPTIVLEMGNRIRRPSIQSSLVIVQGVYQNAETMDRLDEAAEALLAYLVTQHARVSGSTLLEPSGGPEDVSLPIKDVPYLGASIPVRLNSTD